MLDLGVSVDEGLCTIIHTACFGKISQAPGKRGKAACPVANYTRILHQHISTLSTHLVAKVLNHELQDWLNLKHGVGSNTYREIEQSCRNGVTEGWLCQYEAGVSIMAAHYGRPLWPNIQTRRTAAWIPGARGRCE
jgi:hypothetical protein